MPSGRWSCGLCGSDDTWAHYEHQDCPVAPLQSGIYAWGDVAEKGPGPDGRPQPQPCPGCNDGVLHECLYAVCQSCYGIVADWRNS